MTDRAFPALSVRQPWAELILSGRKAIEIRTWRTNYRGRLWIHAASHVDEALDARFGLRDLYRRGFIGSVELTSVEPFDARRWEDWREWHLDHGPYRPGQFAWVLSNPRRLAFPVDGPGNLKLFDVPPDTLSDLIAADSEGDQ